MDRLLIYFRKRYCNVFWFQYICFYYGTRRAIFCPSIKEKKIHLPVWCSLYSDNFQKWAVAVSSKVLLNCSNACWFVLKQKYVIEKMPENRIIRRNGTVCSENVQKDLNKIHFCIQICTVWVLTHRRFSIAYWTFNKMSLPWLMLVHPLAVPATVSARKTVVVIYRMRILIYTIRKVQ